MISKINCYSALFDLKAKGINVSKQLNILAATPTVPVEIIKFINENRPTNTTKFYEGLRIKNNKKSSKLYKNIVSEDFKDPIKSLKTASSLVTQILIAAEKLESGERQSFYEQARVNKLTKAISTYFNDDDIKQVFEELKFIRDDIKVLESK